MSAQGAEGPQFSRGLPHEECLSFQKRRSYNTKGWVKPKWKCVQSFTYRVRVAVFGSRREQARISALRKGHGEYESVAPAQINIKTITITRKRKRYQYIQRSDTVIVCKWESVRRTESWIQVTLQWDQDKQWVPIPSNRAHDHLFRCCRSTILDAKLHGNSSILG